MFHGKYFFYFVLSHFITATPQINLYYTDWVNESDNALQHNCLRISTIMESEDIYWGVASYCMSELPSKFKIENNDFLVKFTFAELLTQNITSEQLYLWSAPIDLIECYQFYLDQLSTANDSSSATEIFYNCTMPRFGPMCQYELHYHYPHHSSLLEIVNDFYHIYQAKPNDFTCYKHLQCNRGPSPACLDWSEICDGKIDCLNGGHDEEYCWQLEINQCKDDEYRCMNGQCIPKSFFRDQTRQLDCVDGSDRDSRGLFGNLQYMCPRDKPSIDCDDITCNTTHLTSSCMPERKELLLQAMYSIKDNLTSEHCWSALKCLFKILDSEYSFCSNLCANNVCIDIIKNNCPDMLYFPNVPVFFGHVYFAFRKSDTQYLATKDIGLLYICHNNSRYDAFFNRDSKVSFNSRTCFVHQAISYPSNWSKLWNTELDRSLSKLYHDLTKYQLIFTYISALCNRSNMYQCVNSFICISIHRLMDNIYDCPHMDDENIISIANTDVIEQLKQTHYKCETSDKYIHRLLTLNHYCDCEYSGSSWCDDEVQGLYTAEKNISFQITCNGFVELPPIIINGSNETDETECEQWECNNIYTRCNYLWNCLNGADEMDCPLSSPLNCSFNHHACVSPATNQLMCLPIEKANDGNVDCLGATDEPSLCRSKTVANPDGNNFYCMNQISQQCVNYLKVCDRHTDCDNGDDEQFCTTNATLSQDHGICYSAFLFGVSDVEKFLCHRMSLLHKINKIYFSFARSDILVEYIAKNIEQTVLSSSAILRMSDQHQSRCHRGLDVRVWLNNENNSSTNTCLCPPSFYGDQCQYQNQRISLSIKFQALSDSWQTLFAIVISLIDDSDERIIHSYEQLSYWSVQNCKTKFNIYLIYSTRPKDPTKHYFIHIDIYEKISLTYRGSLLLPVRFSFLPVYRLALVVNIPPRNNNKQSCSNDRYVHGKCIQYSNNPENVSFGQCDQGWVGKNCTIQHTSLCSSDSLCIGVSAHSRSVCVCPINKFGSRCLLTNTTCQTNNSSICKNGGRCIFNDDYMVLKRKFICICPRKFSGDQCEIVDNELILSFGKDITISQSMFIHFIEIIFADKVPVRSTAFRTILVKQDSITVYWSRPFHLVFIELANKNYYLIVVQKTYNQSTTTVRKVNPSNRCPHISELFNETFAQWHLIRRIKYYHLPCQRQSLNLSCFYDDVHFCLCYSFGPKRLANCLAFDHQMTFDCLGQSECENGAGCLQDDPKCPKRSICMCNSCFYGRRCQFSTSGFGLSLDAILGYHILPHLSLVQQSFIIQMSSMLTIIFIIAGFINGISSLITFKNKTICQVGCGLYLLSSSITTLLTITIFGLKFLILLLAQMTIISNRSFLSFQCHSMDFILRVCFCLDQWFNACVAAERAITTIKGVGFVKKKSKKAAKVVIVILIVVLVGTCMHDPIYRRLLDEENDDDVDDVKRIWCVVTYPPKLKAYDHGIYILHFFGPFLINLISSVVLITKKSRQQSNLHQERPYKDHLREQCDQHKHLFAGPLLLVILAIPRLIITLASKCMKSVNDSWLYLGGYFISFIPSMLTFIIFILPSEFL